MTRAVERKRDVIARMPIVFGLGAAEAAASISISAGYFRRLVAEGRMPPARRLDGRQIWDVDELRAAFKALPHDDAPAEHDEWADVG